MKYLALTIGLVLMVTSNLADGLSLRDRLAQWKNDTTEEDRSSEEVSRPTESPDEEEDDGPGLLLKELDTIETNCTGNHCDATEKTCQCNDPCEYVFRQDPCYCKRDWHCRTTNLTSSSQNSRTKRGADTTTTRRPVKVESLHPVGNSEPDTDSEDEDEETSDVKKNTPTKRTRRDTDEEREARRKDNKPTNGNHGGNAQHGKHNSTTTSHTLSNGKHNSTSSSNNGATDKPKVTSVTSQGSRTRRDATDPRPDSNLKNGNSRPGSQPLKLTPQQGGNKTNNQTTVTPLRTRHTRGAADTKVASNPRDSNSSNSKQGSPVSTHTSQPDNVNTSNQPKVTPTITRHTRGAVDTKPALKQTESNATKEGAQASNPAPHRNDSKVTSQDSRPTRGAADTKLETTQDSSSNQSSVRSTHTTGKAPPTSNPSSQDNDGDDDSDADDDNSEESQ